MLDTLRIAFIGCGAIARYHLDGIHDFGDRIRVAAAVDPDLDKARVIAAETGAEVYPSLDAALKANCFDAVDIMVPHDIHEELAMQALKANKHVVLEKPIATSLDAAERIIDVARKAGTVFMVAENAQYWPEIVCAKKLIDTGAIGEVITARATFFYEYEPKWFDQRTPWRMRRSATGGGIAIDGGSHWIRPLRMWMGEIDSVVGITGRPMESMEGESLAHAIFRFQSGKFATFHALNVVSPLFAGERWRVTGTKGELVIGGDWIGGELKIFDAEHREGRSISKPGGYPKSFGLELDDFADAVLKGTPLAAIPEFSLGELRTALSIYRSAESGRWEKVWD